jgi:DNA (cytosine-5)-methyltransferase 1
VGRGQPELGRLARRARSNRVGRLKGYGNAIVPEVAAMFVRAFMEAVTWPTT